MGGLLDKLAYCKRDVDEYMDALSSPMIQPLKNMPLKVSPVQGKQGAFCIRTFSSVC